MLRWVLILFLFVHELAGQCDPYRDTPLSPRIANYDIDLVLNHELKSASGTQTITWKNTSPDTIDYLRLYMYLNAFSNTESTFMRGAGANIFGQDISTREEDTWGWVEVSRAEQRGSGLISDMRYVHPDDDNLKDRSVLEVPLIDAVLPGESVHIDMTFESRLPELIARSGYGQDDYFMFTHWFPQVGVYEQDNDGRWGWNCHQFHRRTEFYSDFGVYDVRIDASAHLTVGASGCLISSEKGGDDRVVYHYRGEDIIDFAWTAYPRFEQITDSWKDVEIRLLIAPEHRSFADRLILTVKQCLEYLTEHVGEYHYPSITIVDPPLIGLRSGFMEYPTFITGGSFYRFPKGIKTLESLIAHEFCHQYFMGMLASNEKEEAWLDEGFVTYYEDRVMEAYYGKKTSLFDIFGYTVGNAEFSRNEYVSMPNPSLYPIATKSWNIVQDSKGIIYSKTATMLKTLEGYLGVELFDKIIKEYFQRYKFKHPRRADVVNIFNEFAEDEVGNLDWFFDQALDGTDICDYAVGSVQSYKGGTGQGIYKNQDLSHEFKIAKSADQFTCVIRVDRCGGFVFPQEIVVTFEDGTQETEIWDGRGRTKEYRYESSYPILSVELDPEKKCYLDVNLNNNSFQGKSSKSVLYKYAAKTTFWVQNILQSLSFLI